MTTESRQPVEPLLCFVCQARVKTSQGLHWHLRREHSIDKEEAYAAVGRALKARDESACGMSAPASSLASRAGRPSDARSEATRGEPWRGQGAVK